MDFHSYIGNHSWIQAPNLSNGFQGVLFEYIRYFGKSGDSLLLVAEKENVIPVFREKLPFLGKIECISYSGNIGEHPEIDLNILQPFDKKYDLVLSQALLEHVCRPDNVIENLVNMLNPNGYVFLHTHTTGCAYHAYPIDCVRFFRDFFVSLASYIPAELIRVDENPNPAVYYPNIFAVYRRK